MKQTKLITKLYEACLAKDKAQQQKLLRMEYRKIFQRRDRHKAFTSRWTVVQG